MSDSAEADQLKTSAKELKLKIQAVITECSPSFEKERESFNIPSDPREWHLEVKYWLNWAKREYSIEGLDVSKFLLTGQQVVSLGKETFLNKTPPYVGDLLWEHLQVMIKQAVSRKRKPKESRPAQGGVKKFKVKLTKTKEELSKVVGDEQLSQKLFTKIIPFIRDEIFDELFDQLESRLSYDQYMLILDTLLGSKDPETVDHQTESSEVDISDLNEDVIGWIRDELTKD